MITMTNSSTATLEFCGQLDGLIQETFGFSFHKWHERGLWNDDYERYSIIENGVMLSNISVYKMRMMVNGSCCDYLQLGSVATRSDQRGKGLSRSIMEHILQKYPDTPIFLHGDNSALPYYLKVGFKPFDYKQPYINCQLNPQGVMVKLSIDDPKVDEYLRGRNQFSKILDCRNQYEINWFHLLYGLADHIYELPEIGVLMIAKQQGNTLMIFDMLTQGTVTFSQITPHLHFQGIERLEFGFNPDWLQLDYQMSPIEMDDGTPLMRGEIRTDSEFVIPALIVT